MKLCLRMPLHLIYNVPRDALDKNFKCWKVLAVPDRNSDHGHTAVADPHGTHQHGDCLEDGRMLVDSVIETVLAADPPPYSEQGKTRGRKPKRDSAPGSKKRKGGKKSRKTKTGKAKQASKSKKSKATPVDTAPVSGDVEVGIASSSNGTGTAIAPKKPKKSRKGKTEDARHAAMNEHLSNPETSNCREASKPATHKLGRWPRPCKPRSQLVRLLTSLRLPSPMVRGREKVLLPDLPRPEEPPRFRFPMR